MQLIARDKTDCEKEREKKFQVNLLRGVEITLIYMAYKNEIPLMCRWSDVNIFIITLRLFWKRIKSITMESLEMNDNQLKYDFKARADGDRSFNLQST